jgi:hypothetical protein
MVDFSDLGKTDTDNSWLHRSDYTVENVGI